MALLEAMSKGLPIVATRAGGVSEMLTHGVDASLVACNDAPALADAALGMLRSPEIAGAMGKKAQERFARENALENYVSHTQDLYGELLSR